MSQHLVGSVKSILGIDISEKMIEAYNQKMERLDEAKDKATAVQMNIMQDYDVAYADRKFDVIVVSNCTKTEISIGGPKNIHSTVRRPV